MSRDAWSVHMKASTICTHSSSSASSRYHVPISSMASLSTSEIAIGLLVSAKELVDALRPQRPGLGEGDE
jgi:hypothetical protein